MINVIKQERNTLLYSCDCGAKGLCSFKPLDRVAAIVIDLKCPACQETERVTLLQYNDDEDRKKVLDNIEDMDLSWVPYINEEILNDEEY